MDGTSVGLVGAAISLHLFLLPQHLKYHTQIHVRSRHGKNRGRKISVVATLLDVLDEIVAALDY